MKTANRIILSLLSLCLVLSLSPPACAVSQSEIDSLEARMDSLREQKAAKQEEVDALRAEEDKLVELKFALDERNAVTLKQLELLSQEIDFYQEQIEAKAKELEHAKAMELQQLERYRSRVRAMEENGEMSILALFLHSENLAQLIAAAHDMGEIMEYDRELEDKYIAARENTEKVHAEYLLLKAELDAELESLAAEQKELEAQLQETVLLMEEIESRIGEESELLDRINSTMENTQSEIDRMVAELEEQRRQQAAAANPGGSQTGSTGGGGGGNVSSAGSFAWPCPSTTYITSRFGPRYHPVTGEYQSTHAGLDIGASYGSSICASASGTVTCAGVNGGYGNCVMVDHGGGYYTLYAHMSSIAVSYGQTVSSGDVLGYVGDTGLTTGPHLHFEIRVNGGCVDPASYFGGLSYAPDA